MCILTTRGAMRVEPQFGGQSLIVPQGGVVSFSDGQVDSLRNNASSCSCDFPRASMENPRPSPSREIYALSHPIQPNPRKPNTATPPAHSQEPIYTVIMPALSFDANSPAPPADPSSDTMLLVHEIRMRPAAVFRGHVNPAPVRAAPTAPAALPPPRPVDDRRMKPQPSLMTRLRYFFHKMAGQGPCANDGCGD
jgi:hypothetical protein